MSYEFPITNQDNKKGICCSINECDIRVEFLPVESCRPIEIFIGEGNAEDLFLLLHVEEFRALVNSLEALCQHWEAGGE